MTSPKKDYAVNELVAKLRQSTVLGIATLISLFLLITLLPRIAIPISSGHMGILYRFFSGTDMVHTYGEGLNFIWPWNHMDIYDLRLRISERNYKLLTKSGLPVDVNVVIRFKPDARLITSLHVNVGPDYADKIVLPEVEHVLRNTIGQLEPEDVYMSSKGFLENIVVKSLESTQEHFIIIDNVLIKSISLPAQLNDAILKKLSVSEELKAFEFKVEMEKKEAERKAIEANGIRDYQKIISQTLSPDLIRWQGILAMKELSTSQNAKTLIIGSGKDGVPLFLNDR